jgi:translation initiation factor IF-2
LAIRIYTLAKELKIDNKKLVDICAKAGITGKGSALASLTDEEEARVRAVLSGVKGPKETAGGRPDTGLAGRSIRREDYIGPGGAAGGKVPVLPSRPPERPPLLRKKPEEPAAAPVVAPPVVPAPAVAAPATAAPATAAPATAAPALAPPVAAPEAAPLAGAAAAVSPVALAPAEPVEVLPPVPPAAPEAAEVPVAAMAPPPVAPMGPPAAPAALPPLFRPREGRADQEKEKARTEKKPAEKKPRLGIHLAPMPVSAKPAAKAKAKEPTPQKPDIKLPLDAIRAGKAGAKPLLERVRKHEEKKREDLAAKKGGRKTVPAGAEAPAPAEPAAGRGRGRRDGRAPATEQEAREPGLSPLGGREQRQLKRKRAATKRRGDEDESTGGTAPRRTHIRRTGAKTAAPRKGRIVVELPCSVRTFSETVGVPNRTIQAKLLALGTVGNINDTLDPEMAELLAVELGLELDFHRAVPLEQRMLDAQEQPDDPATLVPRPPIVTFLGHVDHGKTSLLDKILDIDVAAHEKGGITQHIRAYEVRKDGRTITFVDTPGHEAFTEMRARGANVTDVAVLVVAADDGVMPQTEEAISHARAAGVPIVVALNKVDLPGVNFDRIFRQLADNDLLPSEWGGETEVVKTSAVTGLGIDQLLETLLTVAELHEYKANPDRAARGTCLEAEMHEDRGVMAKVLVQTGTLRPGDVMVCGAAYGRVKAMYDTLGAQRRREEAGPSTPVNVTGLNVAPGAGDRFHVLESISQARHLAQQRAAEARQRELAGAREHVTLENLFERLGRQDTVQTLAIILRADVRGSIEAIRNEMGKLRHPEVQIRILQATVGGITEADVHLADASDAVIIGFSVVADEGARALAEARGVQIRRYDIIYQVTEDLKAALEGMLKPERLEKDQGRALVQQVFHISRLGTVAGCRMMVGSITRDAKVRVIRDSRIIGDYAVDSLRREKDDVREVREGLECGIKLAGFNDVKEGDILEAYKIEEVRRTLAGSAAN